MPRPGAWVERRLLALRLNSHGRIAFEHGRAINSAAFLACSGRVQKVYVHQRAFARAAAPGKAFVASSLAFVGKAPARLATFLAVFYQACDECGLCRLLSLSNSLHHRQRLSQTLARLATNDGFAN